MNAAEGLTVRNQKPILKSPVRDDRTEKPIADTPKVTLGATQARRNYRSVELVEFIAPSTVPYRPDSRMKTICGGG